MYKRVLLKLSGEALQGTEKNFDPAVLQKLAEEIKQHFQSLANTIRTQQ